jgi:hypothetical protein
LQAESAIRNLYVQRLRLKPWKPLKKLEPATRIERATCGLRIPNPAECADTQSPRKHRYSDDFNEDDPQIGFA